MKPQDELKLRRLALDTSNALLYALLDMRLNSGMPDDQWNIYVIEKLTESMNAAVAHAVEAEKRAVPRLFVKVLETDR